MAGFTVARRGIDVEQGRSKRPLAPGPSASGTSDDSALLQAFLNGLPSGYGALFTQPYKLASPVSLPTNVSIFGLGPGAQILATGNNYLFQPSNHNRISGLSLAAATAQASGGGVNYTNAGYNIGLDNLELGNNLFISLNVTPNVSTHGIYWFDRLRWDGVANTFKAINIGDGTHSVTDLTFTRCSVTAASSTGIVAPLFVNGADTLEMSQCTFYQGGQIVIGQAAGGAVTGSKFVDCVWDTLTTSGTPAVDVVKCQDLEFVGCAVQGCPGGIGVGFEANALMAAWTGGVIQQNHLDGCIIYSGAKHITVQGARIFDNNQNNSAFIAGISCSAGLTDFSLLGNVIGNGVAAGGNQKYGILIPTGASDRYIVTNNRTFGNTTTGVSDGGTGVNKTVTGNL